MDTRSVDYAARLEVAQTARWKEALDVQAPYRWNLKRLNPGYTLDIGCGVGRNLVNLEGVGVDHNPSFVAMCRAKGLQAFTTEEFKGGTFDSLLFAHVLEHVADPTEIVREYLPCLKSGGQVILITPQELGYKADDTHVTYLDLDALRKIVISLGLAVERAYSFPFPRFMGRAFKYNEFVLTARKA